MRRGNVGPDDSLLQTTSRNISDLKRWNSPFGSDRACPLISPRMQHLKRARPPAVLGDWLA